MLEYSEPRNTISYSDIEAGVRVARLFQGQFQTNIREPLEDENGQNLAGKLGNIPIADWNGGHLTDAQRVDRYNDFRAFQLYIESNYKNSVAAECNMFLQQEKKKRTQEELLGFFEGKMNQFSERRIVKESKKKIAKGPVPEAETAPDDDFEPE